MKRAAVVRVVTMLAVLALPLVASADPGGAGHGRHLRRPGGPTGRAPFIHRGHSAGHDRFGRHRVFPHRFGAVPPVVTWPVVVYSSPLMDAPTPYPGVTYAAPSPSVPPTLPPVFYDAPGASQAPPAMAPPLQRVVEFPTGRYELRGDGIRTSYTWVWIPNPPTEPPPAGVPSSGDGVPANRSTQIYQWVDEQGVVHWTNRRDTVPPRYRKPS